MNAAPIPFDASAVQLLNKSRRRMAAGTILLFAGTLALGALAVAALVDARWILPEFVRTGFTMALAAAFLTACFIWWRRTKRSCTMEATVRLMESSNPSIGQKLRTAREVAQKGFARDPETAGMARRLLTDAQQTLRSGDWTRLAPRSRYFGCLAAALAVMVIIGITAARWPDFRLALRRLIFPVNAPSYTGVAWAVVPAGFDDRNPPRFAVQLSGRMAEPVLMLRESGEPGWTAFSLTALADGYTHDAILTGRKRSFEAFVKAGDGRTETRTIHYRPIPRLMAASVTVALPDYTGRQPSKRDGGDVRALEGSRLDWEFTFNTPPAAVRWEIAGASGVHSLPVIAGGTGVKTSWKLAAGKFAGTLTVEDGDGAVIDAWKYEISGEMDALPRVEILEPSKDAEATPVTELPVRIRARDDYGVAEIGLIMEAAGEKYWTMEKTVDALDQKELAELTHAMLETVPLTVRDNVRVYAYALDHKPRGGPRAVSPLRSIDIREFKKRSLYLGKVQGPPIEPKEVTKLNEVIRMQRGVVSDAHLLNEEARGAFQGSLSGQCAGIGGKESLTLTAAQGLLTDWQVNPSIPRDDLALLGTASIQMKETVSLLNRAVIDRGFLSADRALTSLLQLRRHLLELIMESDSPSPGDPAGNDEMKKLDGLAKEAERLAGEEQEVREQLDSLKKDGLRASIEVSRRQQEVALSDAGELYASIVAHPQKNDGMLRLMGDAEAGMKLADAGIHSADPLVAAAPLEAAEGHLRDLADFIRSMETKKLAETLKQMAGKARADAANAGSSESQTPDGKEPKPEGQKGGEAANAESKPETAGAKEKEETDRKAAEQAARNTALADEILKTLAQQGDKPGDGKGGEKPGGTPGEAPGSGNSKSGSGSGGPPDTLTAAEIARLRGDLGTEALARELKERAEGKGSGQDGGPGRKLSELAKALDNQAKKLESSRLARLAAVKTQAKALREQITKENNKRQAAEDRQLIESLRKQGFTPGMMISVNGRKIRIPEEGEGSGENPGEGENPGQGGKRDGLAGGGFGPSISRFVSDAQRLNDEPLTEWTRQLETTVPQRALQPLKEAEKRLDELIAALPGGGEEKVQVSRIPEASRREVEDYFKNLSDDFGGDSN